MMIEYFEIDFKLKNSLRGSHTLHAGYLFCRNLSLYPLRSASHSRGTLGDIVLAFNSIKKGRRMKNNILLAFIPFIMISCNTNDNDYPIITPAKCIDKMFNCALEYDSTYKLLEIYSGGPYLLGAIDSNGFLYESPYRNNSWTFVFYKVYNNDVFTRQILIYSDGSIKIKNEIEWFDTTLYPRISSDSCSISKDGWIDIDSAIIIAKNNGGRNYLINYSSALIHARLTRLYSIERNLLTWIIEFSDNSTFLYTVNINAQTGSVIAEASPTSPNKRVAVHSHALKDLRNE